MNAASRRTQSPLSMLRQAYRARSRAPHLTAAAWFALASAASCAGPGQDVHVAPLYSNLSTAGGGREVEGLAGALRIRYATPEGPWTSTAFRPLASRERLDDGSTLSRFLVPLGTERETSDESVTQLLPVSRFSKRRTEEGEVEWRFFGLPAIFWSKDTKGDTWRAIFPLGGRIRDSFTYDSLSFVLWPLYMRTEREGRVSHHVLWPLFVYSTKPGLKKSYRLFPFYGVTHSDFYTRRFWLWPLFHTQENLHGNARDEGDLEQRWSVWPLYSYGRRGSYRAVSAPWPFVGWAHDPESGFWAWDGPWPLVRIQRPGTETDVATRTRFWPFYSHYRGDELDSTWLPWPFVNLRTETYRNGSRESEFVLPFWQSWEKVDADQQPLASFSKLWPLYQVYRSGESGRSALPALNPLWHTPVLDDHYAFLYELYTRDWTPAGVRERSWGGLWRRERDATERRSYVAGLWARRVYARDGARHSETSLLFGLVRWRSREGDFAGFLRPALPGPGFPHERSSEQLASGARP